MMLIMSFFSTVSQTIPSTSIVNPLTGLDKVAWFITDPLGMLNGELDRWFGLNLEWRFHTLSIAEMPQLSGLPDAPLLSVGIQPVGGFVLGRASEMMKAATGDFTLSFGVAGMLLTVAALALVLRDLFNQ